MSALRGALTLLVVLVVTGTCSVAVAQEWTVEAHVDHPRTTVGSLLKYTITASGSGNFEPLLSDDPDFGSLQIVRREPRSKPRTTDLLGRMTTTYEFVFRIKARRSGTHSIGPATIDIDGKSYVTQSVTIEAAGSGGSATGRAPIARRPPRTGGPAQAGPGPKAAKPAPKHRVAKPGEDWFVEVELEREEVWLGEPLWAHYRFLKRQGFNAQVHDVQEPDFQGFWARELQDSMLMAPSQADRLNQTYYVESLRKYVIVPLETGQLEVNPIHAQIVSRNRIGATNKEMLASAQPRVQVKALPPNPPAGFDVANVATGVSMEATARATDRDGLDQLRVGDSVKVSVELSLEGVLELMSPSAARDANGAFLVFGPDVEDEDFRVSHSRVWGSRRFVYTYVAAQEGELAIPEIHFSYFDHKAEEYRTASVGPFAVVVKGEAPTAGDVLAHRERADAAATQAAVEVAPDASLRVAELGGGPGPALYTRWWYLLIMGLSPAMWLVMIAGSRMRSARSSAAPDRRSKGAGKTAKKDLRSAKRKDGPEFLGELDKIVRDYLGSRFGLRARSLTSSELRRGLKSKGAADQAIEATIELLEEASAARYGGSGAIDSDAFAKRAKSVVNLLEAG